VTTKKAMPRKRHGLIMSIDQQGRLRLSG